MTFARVQTILLRENEEQITLPSWLRELPALRHLDASWTSLAEIPDLPHVRFALEAETLQRCSDQLSSSQIDGVSVGTATSAAAIRHIWRSCAGPMPSC